MRLQIVSDLHLEWQRDGGSRLLSTVLAEDVDALVLAGDAVSLVEEDLARYQLAAICRRYPRVYYIPGNHEFYRLSAREGTRRLERIASTIDSLVLLDTGRIDRYRGYRILGATMWFPFDPANALYDGRNEGAVMADLVLIEDLIPWVYEQNTAFRRFLEADLQAGDIVLTHHLPAFDSVHREYVNSDLNRFFVSDQRDLIVSRKPALWVHGHTHRSMDYWIGPTHVLCNPYGYPVERNATFDPRLTIALPEKDDETTRRRDDK